ncbi:MAG: hypothetical protein ABIK62_00120, partial [candidate division WOR-3 bacterium]
RKKGLASLQLGWGNYDYEYQGSSSRHRLRLSPSIGAYAPALEARADLAEFKRTIELLPEISYHHRALKTSITGQLRLADGHDTITETVQPEPWLGAITAKINVEPSHALLLEGVTGFMTRRAGSGGSSDLNQIFGTLSSNFATPVGFQGQVMLDRKYEPVLLKEEVFVRVEPGRGEYRWNPEEHRYFPDTSGDFVRRLVASGKQHAVVRTDLDINSRFTRWHWLDLEFQARLGSQADDSVVISSTEMASIRAQLIPSTDLWSLVIAHAWSQDCDRQSFVAERTSAQRSSAQARFMPPGSLPGLPDIIGSVLVSVGLPIQQRTSLAQGLVSREVGIIGTLEPNFRAPFDLETSLELGMRTITMPRFVASSFRLSRMTLGVGRQFRTFGQILLNAHLSISRCWSNISRLPYELQISDPLGWSHDASLSLARMLGSALSATAEYRLNRRPGQTTEHNLSAGIRAHF